MNDQGLVENKLNDTAKILEEAATSLIEFSQSLENVKKSFDGINKQFPNTPTFSEYLSSLFKGD